MEISEDQLNFTRTKFRRLNGSFNCDKLSQLYIDPPILGETLRLIRRYEMIVANSEKQSIIEDLPVSLTYEIAG